MPLFSKRISGILSLAIVTALWGLSFPLVKNAIADIPPFLFNALRFDVAALALLLLLAKKIRTIRARTVWVGFGIGAVLFLGYTFQTLGLVETTATNSAFLTALNVLFVPLFGAMFGHKLQLKMFLGVGFACVGLWFLTGTSDIQFNRGDFLTILCAFAFAFQILFVGRASDQHNAIVLTACQMIAVAVLSHIGNQLFEVDHRWPASPRLWGYLVFTGIFISAIPFAVQIQAQRHVSAITTAMVFSTEPIWGALAAFVMLNEQLTWLSYLGGCLMILGIVIVEMPRVPKLLSAKPRVS
jgi:drug/metabolite transporter (DMT)-like permease